MSWQQLVNCHDNRQSDSFRKLPHETLVRVISVSLAPRRRTASVHITMIYVRVRQLWRVAVLIRRKWRGAGREAGTVPVPVSRDCGGGGTPGALSSCEPRFHRPGNTRRTGRERRGKKCCLMRVSSMIYKALYTKTKLRMLKEAVINQKLSR